MAKKIVLLCDGTGNSASRPFKSNVWRLYQALDLNDGAQIAAFSDGVGTSSFRPWAIIGLALGFGVKSRVLALYKFLCLNYEDGDKVFVFGFSRGAFIARVIVGLIAREGLVDHWSQEELDRNALAAYRSYRAKAFENRLPHVKLGRYLRDLFVRMVNAATGARPYSEVRPAAGTRAAENLKIRFLGVWDTVAAYGLPVDELTRAVDKWVWPMTFEKRGLLANVQFARQAFSIDDERRTFFPIPWYETDELTSGELPRLRQVWFSGSHSNVGGGYPDDRLAHIPLCWMIDEAARCGLTFKSDLVADYTQYSSPSGRIYDSRSGVALFYRYHPRPAQDLMGLKYILDGTEYRPTDQIAVPVVHASVVSRIVDGGDRYAPLSLPPKINILLPSGRLEPFSVTTKPVPVPTADRAADAQPYPSAMSADGSKKAQANVLDAMRQLQGQIASIHKNQIELLADTVWWRRVVYFAMLAVAIVFALFPVVAGYITAPLSDQMGNETIENVDRAGAAVVGPVVGMIEGFVPRILNPWLQTATKHTTAALLLIAAFGSILWLNHRLRKRIRDRALAVWNVEAAKKFANFNDIRRDGTRGAALGASVIFAVLALAGAAVSGSFAGGGIAILALVAVVCLAAYVIQSHAAKRQKKVRDRPYFLSIARGLRTNETAIKLYRATRDHILPGAFLVASVLLVLVLVNKGSFEVLDSAGLVCEQSDGNKIGAEEFLTAKGDFSTSAVCWNSGVRLDEGVTYQLTLQIVDPWFDRKQCVDVRGFTPDQVTEERPWIYRLGAGLARSWGEHWFKPIARIGQRGNDEYVLEPTQPTRPGDCKQTELISILKPKSGGQLYIYVNDAVVGIPKFFGKFYKRNLGTARLSVRRLPVDLQ